MFEHYKILGNKEKRSFTLDKYILKYGDEAGKELYYNKNHKITKFLKEK